MDIDPALNSIRKDNIPCTPPNDVTDLRFKLECPT